MKPLFEKLLIANRGEIACRIIRTAKEMGIATVAVHSSDDETALHVDMADSAVCIGSPPVSESYLVGTKIIEAALETGADAIHPGYGFLSENPDFVDAVDEAGLIFVGPSASAIRAMGLKDAAKDLMISAGVPVVPGYQGDNQNVDFLAEEAEKIGYPVLIKARAGGGGKGMRKVNRAEDFSDALASAQREGQAAFGDGHVLVEKFIASPRHIEVQVFGDDHGRVVHMFERDCSLQRRHQKVIEEAPAPGMTPSVREAMTAAAVKAAKAIGYSGAGTIEFIVDGSGPLREDGFWFMEMNTRLQVEHPVTEAVTGIDLVEWQLQVAAGRQLPMQQKDIALQGHAFEARLYAEDPAKGFLPATGRIEHLAFSTTARNDYAVRSGDVIGQYYDPMIAKVITHEDNRDTALDSLVTALSDTHVVGAVTNKQFLTALARHEGFQKGVFDTGLIERDLEVLTSSEILSTPHIAFAAIAMLGLHLDRPHLGFRLWDEAHYELIMLFGGEEIRCSIEINSNGTMTLSSMGIESTCITDIRCEGAMISARFGTVSERITARVYFANRDNGKLASVMIGGVTSDLMLVDPRIGNADSGADHSNAVIAPMTGTIVSVLVKPGDEVEAGGKLAVMEAMKMETALTAPRAATISNVLCVDGDSVEDGAALFLFDEVSKS